MSVDAFVLPVPEGSYGVVFWEPRRRRRPSRGSGGASAEDVFAVYAPAPLTAAESAVLQSGYHASIGEAMCRGDRHTRSRGTLLLWWMLGIAAVLLLTARAFEWGPGMSWLVLVASLFTLPLARLGGGWPFSDARHAHAGRLARHLDALPEIAGNEPRLAERCTALWQFARRQHGTEREQVAALEGYCREHTWPAAARFYRDRLESLDALVRPSGGWRRWPSFGWPGRGIHYSAVEMGNR